MNKKTKNKLYNKQIRENNLHDKRTFKTGNKRNKKIIFNGFKVIYKKGGFTI